MQAVQDEYVTQHTTTGTIMQTDHRIAIIAGYLTGEVTGMSAYDYVYKEDLEYTLKAQSLSKLVLERFIFCSSTTYTKP